MLNDKIVPIDYPNVSIRSHFGHSRGRPLIIACNKIEWVGTFVASSDTIEDKSSDQVPGWLAYKGNAIPPTLGILASSIESMACTRRVTAVPVNLANIWRGSLKHVGVCDRLQDVWRPTVHAFVVAIGDRHESTGISVGGRTKDEPFFADSKPPRVVVGGTHELQLANANGMAVEIVRPFVHRFAILQRENWGCLTGRAWFHRKSPEPLSESLLTFTVDDRRRIVVTLHGPNPVIEPVLKIAHAAMRIGYPPTGDEFLTHIRHIVAIGVFQVNRGWAVLNDGSTAKTNDRRRNAHVRSKNSELVGDAIVIGIFAYSNTVAAFARWLQLVRVIDCFTKPQSTSMIPIHGQWLAR